MKKSIGLYFNNNKLEKDKLLKIKEIGFDEFFADIFDMGEDLSLKDQCEFAKSIGLKCTMIHCLYYEPDLHFFWEECARGDKICDDYCNQIRKIKGLTENFVVHLNADKNQSQSKVGLKRIKQMLAVCEEIKVNLCIENLYSETEIPYIFENINHKRLKICYDVGHQNFLTPNFEILKNYHAYIEVLHLHDNHGISDEHLICGYGNINWASFAKDLKLLPNIVLSAEIRQNNYYGEEFLKDAYNSLAMIENLIVQ